MVLASAGSTSSIDKLELVGKVVEVEIPSVAVVTTPQNLNSFVGSCSPPGINFGLDATISYFTFMSHQKIKHLILELNKTLLFESILKLKLKPNTIRCVI